MDSFDPGRTFVVNGSSNVSTFAVKPSTTNNNIFHISLISATNKMWEIHGMDLYSESQRLVWMKKTVALPLHDLSKTAFDPTREARSLSCTFLQLLFIY